MLTAIADRCQPKLFALRPATRCGGIDVVSATKIAGSRRKTSG
jgi:hypothetical protein